MPNNEIAYINGASLNWAIKRIKANAKVVSDRTKISESDLIDWIDEKSFPSFSKIRIVCKFLKINIATLYLPVESLEGRKIELDARRLYESLGDISVETRLKVLTFVEKFETHRNMSELLGLSKYQFGKIHTRELGSGIKNLIGIDSFHGKYANKAKVYKNIKLKLSEKGIVVFQVSEVPLSEFRALVVHDEDYPAIIVNRNDSYSGRIFSLVHEIAHILTGSGSSLTLDSEFTGDHSISRDELEIDRMISEILMPREDIIKYVSQISFEHIGLSCDSISKRFVVSPLAIARRLVDLKYIEWDSYKIVRQYCIDNVEKTKISTKWKGGFIPPSADCISQNGGRFINSVVNAYNKKLITISDALSAIGVKYNTFKKIEAMT